MSKTSRNESARAQGGFSLLELVIALVVTLVITGAMYGLILSGQGSFQREPAITDRQQQIRLAMTRLQEDILVAGQGLGNLVQSFSENMNAVGILGVRPVADAASGGGNSDHIEIRTKTADCPSVRVDPANPRNGANYNAIDGWPACYPEPGWVLAFFPDGNAKWGWGHNQHAGGNQKFNFPPGQQPAESQMTGVANLSCSLDLTVTGNVCPPQNQGEAIFFMQMDRIRYQIAIDADGTPSLFRSTNAGFDQTTQVFTAPPSSAWQQLARGIEDLQIRYRVQAGWVESAPTILPLAASPYDNIVREVEITMWGRTLNVAKLKGETVAAGNGVTALRGNLITRVSPRAAQDSLMFETDPAKRWQ